MRVVLSGRLTTVAIGTAPPPGGQGRAFHPGERDAALRFVRRFTQDAANCAALRRLLAHEGIAVSRLSDNEVAAEVAARLSAGRLFLLDGTTARAGPAPVAAPPAPSPSPAPAPPPRSSPAERKPGMPEVEEPTFGEIDQDEQAAVLVAAAEEGVPFCEECERLSREAAAGGGS